MKFPWAAIIEVSKRRPPRGGRGLKFDQVSGGIQHSFVAPLAGGVD